LAYSLSEPTGYRSVYVHALSDRKSRRVTPPLFYADTPAWDPKGELLYFLSVREFQPAISMVEWSFSGDRMIGVFALALNKKVQNPFAPKNDEVGGEKQDEPKDDEKPKKPEPLPKMTVDFASIEGRAIRVPLEADNYRGLAVTGDAILTSKSAPEYYGREPSIKPSLIAFSFEKKKAETLADDVKDWSVAPQAKKVLVALGNGQHKLLAVGGDNKDVEPMKLDGLAVIRIPAEEWAAIFDEVWRRYRDYFYVPNMHGYDWPKLRNKYAALLPHVASRADLNYVLGEMVGELNVSHAYVQGGDFRLPARPNLALGGARFTLDRASNRYRISTIFAGQNEEERYRSPLTEVGVDARIGDYLLAVNGRELTGAQSPWELMIAAPGQLAEWRVGPTPDGRGARTIRFRPRTSETDLIYLASVRRNMERVERATRGRIGYLHLADMGDTGIREFIKWWYPQLGKQGMIIDVRSNGGGNISPMLLERIKRQVTAMAFGRNMDVAWSYPSQALVGPMVTLINETSGSDGDLFPWQFRIMGLGPLIGKRTWGGVVGITNRGPLLDGGLVFVPEFAHADAKGQWAVEGEGVTPDIEVEQDPIQVLAGRDPQLERAITEVLKRLAPKPGLPSRPAAPVKIE
jgi:tricorn protease